MSKPSTAVEAAKRDLDSLMPHLDLLDDVHTLQEQKAQTEAAIESAKERLAKAEAEVAAKYEELLAKKAAELQSLQARIDAKQDKIAKLHASLQEIQRG
jgi:chromosome segregation ATPase